MEEKQFRMDFDAFLRSFKQSKNGSFAFLLGAGASITSGVQSAEDCIWDWKKLIYVTNNPTNEAFLDIHSDCCRKKIQTWLNEQRGYPIEKSDENMFSMQKKHSHCLAIEQDILRVYVLIRIRILDINFCAYCINIES